MARREEIIFAKIIQVIKYQSIPCFNNCLKSLSVNMLSESILNAKDSMIIGYYPMRGKAQMCRLLCEYLHLPYRDLLFTPKTWEEFKADQNLNWTFQQLPFLKDGDTVVTETYPICLYLLHKANKKSLLGSNLLQEIKIDSEIWKIQPASYLMTAFINHRDLTPDVKAESIAKMWAKSLQTKLTKLQRQTSDKYFYEEITLLDFYLYETIYFLLIVSSQKMKTQFPKLMQVYNRMANIPEIKAYQLSKKCITEVCPVKFCINWRQKCYRPNN